MASLQQGGGGQPGRAAGGAGASPAPCGGADRGRVPILVVEEDPPLDMDKVRRWTKRKLARERKEREERDAEEYVVALDLLARDGFALSRVESATLVAWRTNQQRRASDPGADRGAAGSAVRRDPGR